MIEKKSSSLVFQHANANSTQEEARCAPPLIMEYYNCNGTGALETVMTRDSFFEQEEETRKKETTYIVEPRDPPEPQTEIANDIANNIANNNANTTANTTANNNANPNRPRSSLGVHKKKESFFDTLCLPKGLLKKARGGRASPVVVHTLETAKQQQQQQQQQSLPNNNKNNNNNNNNNTGKNQKPPSNGRCVVNIPIYAKEAVGRKAALNNHNNHNKNKTNNLVIDTGHNDETKNDGNHDNNNTVEEDAATLATAAAKWRMAKEKYLVRESRSAESESRDRYSVHEDVISKDSNSNSDASSNASSGASSGASSNASSNASSGASSDSKTKSNDADSDLNADADASDSSAAISRTSRRSHCKDDNGSNHNPRNTTLTVEEPRDPPGTLSGAPTEEEEDGEKSIVANEEKDVKPPVLTAASGSKAHPASTPTNETQSQPHTEEQDHEEPPTDENDEKEKEENENEEEEKEEGPKMVVDSTPNRDYMSQFSKSLQVQQDHQAAHMSMLIERRRALERRKTNRKQQTTITSSSSIRSDDAP